MKTCLIALLIAIALLAWGCGNGPQTVEIGDTVRVDYTGTLDDGTEFDSSFGREPLEFTVGKGDMIPGFENAVIGMAVGEAKTVTIPADQAYGTRRDDLVFTIPIGSFGEGSAPQVGQWVRLSAGDGQQFNAMVIEVAEDTVKLDANHQLAGKDLTFDILLREIL